MRQTLRQIVAVLALGGIALSLVPNALAATYTDISAANKLATAGIIVDQSATPAAYRLGETLLRQEGVGTAAKALGIIPDAPVSEYTCAGKFSDISEAWVCRAAELAAKAGLTNAANTTFRPKDNLTKYEAMLFALRASCNAPEDKSVTGVAAAAVDMGIITNAASFNGTAAATRGEFFRYVATGMEDSACGDTSDEDVLCSLFPDLCVDEEPTDETPATGDVEVSLSDATPAGRTLPKEANGVVVASYDITADDDTVLSGVTLKREGVSEDADVTNFTLAVDGVRVSDSKDENSDDEVTITLKNGGINLDAGDTVTLDVMVDIPTGATTGAEIAVALTDVTVGGDVSGLPVTSETFKVGSATAPSIEILSDGSVSAPELGKTSDLFRFKVKNNNSTNETVTLNAITFEQTGTVDETSELANYKLLKGTEVLATVESTDSKYVAFVLDKPLSITQGNNVALKVVADVVGGAGKTVIFGIDQKLDVSASSAKYGTGTAVTLTASSFASVTIKAGAISLVKTDATATKVREDKDDVVLGSLDIVAGQSDLEVKKIAVAVKSVTGVGVDSAATGCAAGSDDANCYLENVQLRNVKTGARYDLTASAVSVDMVEYSDSSFDFSLAQGSNKFEVIADTLNNIDNFDAASFTLSMVADTTTTGTNGYLVVEETGDDTTVTDVTPSSLTWKKVEGSESGATVSVLPLSDLTKVRGATNVTALQIEIKADESSALTVDEIKALVRTNTDGVTGTATNQMVSQVSLYEGTDTSGTALDSVSGSNLASGVATFEGFEVVIPANGKKTFTVTVSFVDGSDASAAGNSPYRVEVAGADISAQDDENDDVTIGGTYVSARDVTVTDVGTITLTADANNTDNKDAKNVLGGTTTTVFSVDVQATNESVDVGTIDFTYSASSGNLSAAGARAELYLGDTLIATAPNADITSTHIVFGGTNAGELTNLIIPQETKELKLAIVTEAIGYEKAGAVVTGVDVTAVDTTEATGVNSGRDVADATANVASSSAAFAVVPTVLTPSTIATLSAGSSSAKVKLTANSGTNTIAASASTPTVTVDSLTFSAPGAVGVAAADYVLYEEGKSGTTVTGKVSGSNVVFDFADSNGNGTADDPFANGSFTTDKTYVIVPTIATGETASLTLLKTGVQYDTNAGATNIVTSLPNELEFGSRTIN